MHLTIFLQDLAVIMIVAGAVTVIFHRFKQPVVLGYIIAGLILGPHTPPFSFIQDEQTVKTLAELGVIFLMFSLGLEFSISKLFKVGAAALLAAVVEIIFMMLIGYEIGKLFHWKSIDSLFLGAMLAISSTTIIIKALHELGMKKEKFAQIIFGVLIIEDILAIGILALLSSLAITTSPNISDMSLMLGKLLVFLVSSLVIGILTVPKMLSYIAKFNSKEMLLISALALCFGFSLLVIHMGYSVALGAFTIGAIIAESKQIKLIEQLVEPLTNMFSAIFFVSIGLLVDPRVMSEHFWAIILITTAVVVGKVLICSSATFLAGHNGKTSMRVGMGLAQIGEFSFIIASLGISLHIMSPFIYPVIVAVSVITTFLTPYLIKFADPFTTYLSNKIPVSIAQVFNTYTLWLQNMKSIEEEKLIVRNAIKLGIMQIIINLILIVAIFIFGSYLSHTMKAKDIIVHNEAIKKAIILGGVVIMALPFLIAIYRKLKGLSMLLSEIAINTESNNEVTLRLRRVISELIPVVCMLGIIVMLIALSASILPPSEWIIFLLLIVTIIAFLLHRWFVKFHSRLQIAFLETFKNNDTHHKP